jgi:thiol-disulfide isomerase/thioredoxin
VRALTSAVVLLTALCLINLVLTLGVVRRLREISREAGRVHDPTEAGRLPAGADVGAFSALTTDGTTVSRETVNGPTLIGFFSPDCPPCVDAVPEFVGYAHTVPGGRDRVVAVVLAKPGSGGELAAELRDVAQVITGPDASATQQALAVLALPTVYLIDERATVLASGSRCPQLPLLSPA